MTDGFMKCGQCGYQGRWTITRGPDYLAAACGRCGVSYDIGWKTEGYAEPYKRKESVA